MSCKFNYNGVWYNEEQLKELFLNNNTFAQRDSSAKASPKTIEKVKEFLNRVGVDVKQLDSSRYGGVNGVANLLENVIEIANGKENVALPEEAMHFAVNMLKTSGNSLYREMVSKIHRYSIYTSVRQEYEGDKHYQNPDGSPNTLKLKEEAVGKLLAEYYIRQNEGITDKPELMLETKTWWEKFVTWVKSLLRIADFNPFEKAAESIDTLEASTNLKEIAEGIISKQLPNWMGNQMEQAFDNKDYKGMIEELSEQMRGGNYQNIVDNVLNGDKELADKILAASDVFLQSSDNQYADSLINKLDNKIKDYQLTKKIEDNTLDEDMRNYYVIYVDGKEQRVGRTTDWAKFKNLEYTGGRDYFENATPEEKQRYAKLALSGTNGHYDIERIIQNATNQDGTLKSAEEIKLDFKPATNKGVFNILSEFLIGNSNKVGFLYQFEEGSKFRVEQQVFNEKAISRDKEGHKLPGRAGTIDLLVIQPTKGVVIYDWKFMGMRDGKENYHTKKQSQHKLQLGDYKRTLKEAYGIKESEIKAFTIPIAGYYITQKIKETGEETPILQSIRIGKVDIKDETRSFLLPVVPDGQSTGNPSIDKLVSSLLAKYNRIYKKKVSREERTEKFEELEELHNTIRNLQVALNFEPISVEAKNFEDGVDKVISKLENYDSKGKTVEELQPVLNELINTLNSAKYYSDLDEVFISEFGKDKLSSKNQTILESLQSSASAAKNSASNLLSILNKIVAIKAEEEGILNLLSPEKEAKSIINNMIESGYLPVKSMQFLTKTISEARSGDTLEVKNLMDDFIAAYQPFLELAKKKGKSNPLSLIADTEEHKLFRRISQDSYDSIKKGIKDKDRNIILKVIDLDKFKELAKERLDQRLFDIDERTYNQDERIDSFRKIAEKEKARKEIEFTNPLFNGWNTKAFSQLLYKSMKEEENYSPEYKNLLENPEYKPALVMYDFITSLNKRAKATGYLDKSQGERFLAFVNATLAQRIVNSTNKLGTFKESVLDMFTVQEYEEQGFGKKDEETGEVDRSVPTYFTRSLDKDKRSEDLLGIMPAFIRALVHFETSQKLEDLFQSTLLMERNKGHLEMDGGRVVFQADSPKVFAGNSTNTELVQSYIDDQIYGINLQLEDLILRLANKTGNKETAEKRALSIKKTIQVTNRWTQQLAVGLKALIAIPNYFGAGVQAVITAGKYYKGKEYLANHARIIGNKLGATSDIDKALMDMVYPLSEEGLKQQLRGIAWKQSSRKWLSTWSFHDVMMVTNRIPDVAHELTNALTWLKNTMVDEQGNLVNIRSYLSNQPEFKSRYDNPISLKEKEQEFEKKVEEYKSTKSLPKIAKFENDILVVPGMNTTTLPKYRNMVVEYGRKITSQMSRENKAAYRRNIIATSFMMFKNWIIPQIQSRALDIHKNSILDQWEYGRTRLFAKTILHLGFRNIKRMRDILKATPEGIKVMREILAEKQEEYYKKTGQHLDITDEEFFDMMRRELQSEMKELTLLLGVIGMVWGVSAANPPDDDPLGAQNRYKFLAKAAGKMADELRFYYNPLSAQSILQGSIIPSLGILSKTASFLGHSGSAIMGKEEQHPVKYFLNLVPVASQFQNELLPIINPEAAKELGIKTTSQPRIFR